MQHKLQGLGSRHSLCCASPLAGSWLASLVTHGPASVPMASTLMSIGLQGSEGKTSLGKPPPHPTVPAHLKVSSLKLPHWSPSLPPHCRHLLRLSCPSHLCGCARCWEGRSSEPDQWGPCSKAASFIFQWMWGTVNT